MNFKTFSTAVAVQFQSMVSTGLFQVEIDKDLLWQTYLDSFPEGSNPLYIKRTEHDCSCCRSFIRNLGGVVTIVGGKVVSIWDIDIADDLHSVFSPYQTVANALSALVKGQSIANIFLHTEKTIGTCASRQLLEDKSVKTWDHFFVNLPKGVVVKGDVIGPKMSEAKSTHDVMLRGLKKISVGTIDTVLELIAQNSLYRGEEQKFALISFRTLVAAFEKVDHGDAADLFVWSRVTPPAVSKIRNTSIGTLLVDLEEGRDLEEAVKAFEQKVAPANYKRPTAVITKRMIVDAQAKIEELGLTSALERRYATIEDITVNNIMFADRTAQKAMNVFDKLTAQVPVTTRALDRVEEVPADKFFSEVLPKAHALEVMFENRHAGNLVSLIAASDPTAKKLFKWPNQFSWSYAGDLADSIKERVKKAGGQVVADLRCSLSWFNYDDLDLHLKEPNGRVIYYGDRVSYHTGGQLDVDMNAGFQQTRSAVENIFYSNKSKMQEGVYTLLVHQFNRRESKDVGFECEIEFDGVAHSFSYPSGQRTGEHVQVAKFKYSHRNGLEIIESLESKQKSKTLWSVPTQVFHKANVVMLSPNYWDGHGVGNRHYFFMLEGCCNEGVARGFYNEFLTEELSKHRKVFEVVGAKMKTEESDRQLSGLGFSSTQRNHMMCRVKGNAVRTVKVLF